MPGPAISYYFMPLNLYLTFAFGVSWSLSGSTTTAATDPGIGLNFDVGKEWSLSDNWGLGLASRFWYSHTREVGSGAASDLAFSAVGLLFSATRR